MMRRDDRTVAWRPALLILLLLIMVPPAAGSEASVADQVVWPKDVAEPYAARVRAIETALGIQVDYWSYQTGYAALTAFETLEHPEPAEPEIRTAFSDGLLEVSVVRPGAGIEWFSVPAERVTEGDHVIHQVRLEDIPIGIRFEHQNLVTIEAPPQMFARFGEGEEAVWAMADALGVPVERFDRNATREAPLSRIGRVGEMIAVDGPPGIDLIPCDCSRHEWNVRDGVIGSGLMEAVMASGRPIRLAVSPVLDPDMVLPVDRQEAVRLMYAYLEAHGMDRVIEHPEDTREEPFWLRLVFIDHHGLTWRFQAHAQGPDRSAFVEGYLSAITGAVEHAGGHLSAHGGYLDPFIKRPPVWAVLLVVLIAWSTTRRFA